jgi:dTDP-4-amino-4,6-dideoxygalactose transaminase
MLPRKRLDIGWSDVVHGLGAVLFPPQREALERELREVAPGGERRLACLSVRSGLDALLAVLNFPPGSEVLVSAITIRDMVRIVEAHGLVAVPVDVDPGSLAVHPEALKRAIGPKSRALLVAHLFGSRMPLADLLGVARVHGLFVIEDGAQAFTGLDCLAPPQADVSLWSFGPIKTATALAGGILCFRDPALLERVRAWQAKWPERSRWSFGSRLCKYSLLMALAWPPMYTLFVALCRLTGRNHDALISSQTRGFPGAGFLTQIRHRPATALLSLLARRLRRFDPLAIAQRRAAAEEASLALPQVRRPGERAEQHTHWVYPILDSDPEALLRRLWSQNLDATRGASSLFVVPPPADRPDLAPRAAEAMLAELLYLPVYGGLPRSHLERLVRALQATKGA